MACVTTTHDLEICLGFFFPLVAHEAEEVGGHSLLKKMEDIPSAAEVRSRADMLARRKAKEDERFLAQMNAKQLDPAKPAFTYEEVARCWQLVMGEPVEGNEEFLRDYCVPWFDRERDHMCFFK